MSETEEDAIVSIWFKRFVIVISIATLLVFAVVGCCQAISANVVMKVSRTAQDSVVEVGEDLAIDVNIDGVEPSAYRWYFNDELIEGADQRVYSLYSAQVEDAGLYRMEAFDDTGRMLVSMEFSVRVIDNTMPKAGDDTLSLPLVSGIALALAAVMAGLVIARNKRTA